VERDRRRRHCAPDAARSAAPRRGGRSGRALRLKVEGAAALEIQHRGAQIVERVNAYFGHGFIDDIRIVQGAFALRPAPPALPEPDPETVQRIAGNAADVKDPICARRWCGWARASRPAGAD
jgi:hypothetical protein